MENSLAHRFADFAVNLKYTDLPDPVVHEVKRRILDSLACGMGAWKEEPCVVARNVASQFATTRGATVWGTKTVVPTDWAAFANGCLVRYFDYNDTYLAKEPAHPSDNIPAAIAVAEMENASGKDLITAIALAYEIQCRLCDAASLRARGWDHVTYGCFSSALAAAHLMKLDALKTRQAVNIAGVASAALRQSRVGDLSHWKGTAFANAARHGVYAALLARGGMTGPAPIFEGDKGFEKLVLQASLAELKLPGNGANRNDFMIVKTYIKFWPAEYHSQSAIEAALKLRPKVGNVDDIREIEIYSHDAAVDIIGSSAEQWKPQTRETADHSLPYITAAALVDGEITDRQFAPARFRDPKLLELVAKVQVIRSAELSAAYGQAFGNIVTIKFKNGQAISERVDHPRGHPRNPLTDAEIEGKFHALADAALGKKSTAVSEWVWKLDSKSSVADLPALLEASV
jgi:2-methylcitrate dehydratase